MSKYSIGIDFGTLSARAVLVDIATGKEVSVSVYGYQDAVIDRMLPGSEHELPPDFALQNPRDYEDALESLLKDIWKKAHVDPENIVGIGVDFTACTMLPLDEQFVPLCYRPEFSENPHSWVKLWKHHGAQRETDQINYTAQYLSKNFIREYGGKTSSEWMFAKIMETLKNAPEVYSAAAYFAEAADWIVYLMVGKLVRSSCMAGYKSFWSKGSGFPDRDFFRALDPRMENVIEEKMKGEVCPPFSRAGFLSEEMAGKTGLKAGTSVSVGSIDAHISYPAAGIRESGALLMIMGTSLCHILVSDKHVVIDGISGVVEDGVLPGLYGYEAGQAAVGDIYDWFVSNMVPSEYIREVQEKNVNIYDYIEERAEKIKPGSSGLIALDWWNGNRSLLVDSDLSGMLLGMTLTTTPEEIYRAIVEATAYGTKMIVEEFKRKGLEINKIYACGGLARKSPVVMQIFSDVLGMEIHIACIEQVSGFGAAMSGAVAAGKENGGYDSIQEAVEHMTQPTGLCKRPIAENTMIYARLYEEYVKLHDYFGKNGNDVMKILKKIKKQTRLSEK